MTLSLDPKHTALLVIDVLQGGDDDAVYDAGVTRFNEACTAIVAAAHAAGVPVILCDDAHRPPYDRELALWGPHGIAGQSASQPADFLGITDEDIVIPKRRYDGFFQTDLDITLRELGVTTVVAIGCDTNICVLQTLAGAFYRGYDSVVVEDATRTFLIGTQEGGIEYAERCFGSQIATSAQVIDALAC